MQAEIQHNKLSASWGLMQSKVEGLRTRNSMSEPGEHWISQLKKREKKCPSSSYFIYLGPSKNKTVLAHIGEQDLLLLNL